MSSSNCKPSRTRYKLSDEQKEWLSDFYDGFKTHIAPRGTTRRPNAKAWVTVTLTPLFMAEYHSDLTGSEGDEKTSNAADSIYVYYSNQWKLDPSRDRGDNKEQVRVSAENLWAKANQNLVNDTLAEHTKQHPDLVGQVGVYHSVVCQLFKDLPADDQASWKTQAQTEREMQALAAKEELAGDAKKLFSDRFLLRVSRLLKEGEIKAGIHSYAHIATEKEKDIELEDDQAGGTTLLINSVLSPGVLGFKDTNDYRDAANQFGEYIRENLNKAVVDKAPPVAVVPSKEGFPEVPTNYSEQSLRDNRAMVRTSMSAHWQIAGGGGAVAWTEIAKSIKEGSDDWIEPSRMPKDTRFVDPGDMTIDECRSWLSHLSLRQNEDSDESNHFQFCQVYACARHEFPEYTEVLSQEKARRSNNDVQLVRLKGYYRKPNTFEAIKYPESTWKYIRYLRSLTRLAPTPVIDKNETLVYLNWFRGLETDDAEVFNLIRAVITGVNKLERYAPINAENELWVDPDGEALKVPLIIPQSPPLEKDIEVFTQRFWAHRSLFGLMDGFEEGKFGFFARWQELQRAGALYDPVTKTFRGGKLGIAWPMRGLLKVTANIGAALGKVEPPKEAPLDYNLGGPRLEDWKTCVKWLHEWRELIDKAVSNLSVILPDKSRSAVLASLPKLTETAPPKSRKHKAKNDKRGGEQDSDIIGGREKRGAVLPSERHRGAPSTDLLLVPNRESVDFNTRLSIFGPSAPLSPIQRFNGTLQDLSSEVSAYNSRCKQYIARYNEARDTAGDPYDATLLYQVRARVHDKDSEVRPLCESVLKQRGGWLKAESLWSKVEPLVCEGRQTLKQGLVWQHAIETNTATREGPAAKRVKQQLPELLACCWAVKCVVRRFSRFYSLSLSWANHLKDEWESTPMTACTADLVSLVAAIRDWQQDCRRMLQYCGEGEQEAWNEHSMKHYGIPDLVGCWYTYGCPTDGALSPIAMDQPFHIDLPDRVQDVPNSISFIDEGGSEDKEEVRGTHTLAEKDDEPTQVLKESMSAPISVRLELRIPAEKDLTTPDPSPPILTEPVASKAAVPPSLDASKGVTGDKSNSLEVVPTRDASTDAIQLTSPGGEDDSTKDSQDPGQTGTPFSEPKPSATTDGNNLTSPLTPLDPVVSRQDVDNTGENPTSQNIEVEKTPKASTRGGKGGAGRGRGGQRGGGRGRGGGSKGAKEGSKGQEGSNIPQEKDSGSVAKVAEIEQAGGRPQRKRIPTAKARGLGM